MDDIKVIASRLLTCCSVGVVGSDSVYPFHVKQVANAYLQLRQDAERYRKLRDAGDHQTFGEYVVVKCEGLPVGTQTWSGKRLDAICDSMEATDAKPE